MDEPAGDQTPRHRIKKWGVEPFKDWERQLFGDSEHDGVMKRAEIETDRDLEKPIPQLLCDIEEKLKNWEDLKEDANAETHPEVELLLYALVRSGAMNAKVAIESEKQQQKIAEDNKQLQTEICNYTESIHFLTWVMVACGILSLVVSVASWLFN